MTVLNLNCQLWILSPICRYNCGFTETSVFNPLVNFKNFVLILNLNCQLWALFEPNLSIQLELHSRVQFSIQQLTFRSVVLILNLNCHFWIPFEPNFLYNCVYIETSFFELMVIVDTFVSTLNPYCQFWTLCVTFWPHYSTHCFSQ